MDSWLICPCACHTTPGMLHDAPCCDRPSGRAATEERRPTTEGVWAPPGSIRLEEEAGSDAPWWMRDGVPDSWTKDPASLRPAFVNSTYRDAMMRGTPIFTNSVGGAAGVPPEAALKALKAAGWRVAMVRGSPRDLARGAQLDLVREDGVLSFAIYDGEEAHAVYSTTNQDVAEDLEAVLAKVISPYPPRVAISAVHVMARGPMGGISLLNLGKVDTTFDRANYSPKVAAAFDRVVKDLENANPKGRLVILEGPPGTGKSYFIRGLIKEATSPTYVLVPPDMVGDLAHPDLLPVLARLRSDYGGAVVMILEDAEAFLLPRKDNKQGAGAVSTILNMADGIFGQLLDVRLVATTNAPSTNFDEAFMRPGRLSEVIEFGPLEPGPAGALLSKLTNGKIKSADKAMSLAEIYQKARTAGWTPPAPPPRKGFAPLMGPVVMKGSE